MKILMLTPYLPYPLLSGGQIRSYNLLKNLKDKHDITLFSFIRSREEEQWVGELSKYCSQVKVFKRRPAWDPKNIILSGLSPFPFLVAIYFSLSVRRAIAQELNLHRYDLIHAETFYVMPNLPFHISLPTLLVEQTIEYMVYQNFVDNVAFPPFRPLLHLDVLKIKFWEKYYWKRATRLAAMSEEDRTIMGKSVRGKHIDVVANGIDVRFFNQTKKKKSAQPTVLFVGNFKWLPNKDAAVFLAQEIWPLIKKEIPQAKLWIVGTNPTKEINRLQELPGVIVEGEIADIRTAFGQANVLLAPIRNGRGTKYKVLEAMATQLPVVTTPLGTEGINIIPGQHALVATSATDLANQTIQLLRNKRQGRKLAREAKKLITKHYNWKKISADLDKIYQKLGQT
jgi:glycosyltransferase involved in cell wall biosynthesis